MNSYEIRIVHKDRAPVIYACPHASDYAAIRRAQSLARSEDEIEVWRDLECIYKSANPAYVH